MQKNTFFMAFYEKMFNRLVFKSLQNEKRPSSLSIFLASKTSVGFFPLTFVIKSTWRHPQVDDAS